MKDKRTGLEVNDFSGGQVTNTGLVEVKPKFTPDCMNVYAEGMSLRKRLGVSEVNTSAVGTAPNGNGIYNWVVNATQQYLMGFFGNTLSQMAVSGTSWSGTFSTISADSANGTSLSDSLMHFVTYSGNLIMTTENRDKPQRMLTTDTKYFNVEYSGVGTSPQAKYPQVWKEHLWLLNLGGGNQLAEECDSITSWTDNDTGTGDSSQTSFGGNSTFRLRSGTNSGDHAKRTRDIGTVPDDYSVELRTYFSGLTGISSGDYAWMDVYNGVIKLRTRWSTEGLEIYNGSSWQEVGVNTVSTGTWATWKFLVTGGTSGSATVDVLKDSSYVGLQYSCANADAGSDGQIDLVSNAGGSITRGDWYMDYLYINSRSATTEYYTDGDFSGWTSYKNPSGPTEDILPDSSVINIHHTFNDSSDGSSIWNAARSVVGGSCMAGASTINSSVLSNTGGKIARCFSFTSASSHHFAVASVDVADIKVATVGYVSFWVKPVDEVVGDIFSLADSTASHSARVLLTTSLARFQVVSAGDIKLDFTGGTSLTTGAWYHVVLVQNGTPAIYVNGNSETLTYSASTTAGAWFGNLSSVNNAQVGCVNVNNGGLTNFFNGQIDDLRVASTAITADHVKAIYAEGNGTEGPQPKDGTETQRYMIRMNPAIHYKMNDTAASTVVTDGGYLGVNGTASANASVLTVASVSAKISTAFSFTSASSHNIQMNGHAAQLIGHNRGTIAFWANMGSVDGVIFFAGNTGGEEGFFQIHYTTAQNINVDLRSSNGTTQTTMLAFSGASFTTASGWNHIAIVQDAYYPKLYLNGTSNSIVPLETNTLPSAWFNQAAASGGTITKVYIGQRGTAATAPMQGKLDDFRIYERPLAASEVWALYNGGSGTEDSVATIPGFRSFRTEAAKNIGMLVIDSSNPTVAMTGTYSEQMYCGFKEASEFRDLLRFSDLGTISSAATIKSANLNIYAVSAVSGSQVITVYECLKAWTTAATWNKYDGTNDWATAGAKSAADDYTTTSVGSAHIFGTGTQHAVVALNSTGIAALQAWVSGTRSNNGLIFANLNTATNGSILLRGVNYGSTFVESRSDYMPYLDVAFTLSDQSTERAVTIGSEAYLMDNRGDYSMTTQTVTSGSALAGVASVFGVWVKADAGITHKLRVDDGTSLHESAVFTGNGAWQYRSLSFTPVSSAGTVKAQIISTKEGRVAINHASIIPATSQATNDLSDRMQRTALQTYNDFDGTDSGTNDFLTAGDVGLSGSAILNDRMYVFKKWSIHRVTYTGSTPLLDLKQIKTTVGTASPRSIKNIDIPGKGEVVIFLGTDRQIYIFDGIESVPLSEVIQVNNGISSIYLNNVNAQALDEVHAMVHPALRWYEIFLPIGAATKPTNSIVVDYSRFPPAFWPFDNRAFESSAIADNGAGQRVVIAQGNSTGKIYYLNSTNSDNGDAINSYWTSFKLGSPVILGKMDEVEVQTDSVSATPSLSWRMDWESSWVTKTLGSARYTHNYNPGRIDNLIQFKIEDNSSNPTFKLWTLGAYERPVGGGK